VKLITYSLWGDNPVYTIGAIKNAKQAMEMLPDWTCRFYIADTVDSAIVRSLELFPNVQTEMRTEEPGSLGMFWRFEPAEDTSVSHMISRDTDCRFCAREVAAINEWVDSGEQFHIMRDHPYHGVPMLGGMWGCRGGSVPNIIRMMKEFNATDEKSQDQSFLWKHIHPLSLENCMVHDPFFTDTDFPITERPSDGVDFVGQCFDENDKPGGNWKHDLEVLEEALWQK
jgi:hypothetical protein